MNINILLLILMVITALWTVMTRSLIKATIALAVTSAVITIIMFRLDSPLAAVFELSVCTGLITVVFISTISLTKPLTHKEIMELSAKRFKRYWLLPVIMVLAAAAMVLIKVRPDIMIAQSTSPVNVRDIMWNVRGLDLIGQIILMITGAFGVVILFKEKDDDK